MMDDVEETVEVISGRPCPCRSKQFEGGVIRMACRHSKHVVKGCQFRSLAVRFTADVLKPESIRRGSIA